MKKGILVLIILTVVFGIYFGITYFLFNEPDEENPGSNEVQKDEVSLIFNNNVVIKYQEGEWFASKSSDYSGKLVDVYDGNSYIGKKYISYNNRWYINDNNMNFYDLNSNLFAYIGDYIITNKNIEYLNIDNNDTVIISNYLSSKKLAYIYNNLFVKKYSVDIDDDNIQEYVYILVNAETLDMPLQGEEFVGIFINDTSGIKEIMLETSFECEPDLLNVINLDSKKYMINTCVYPSNNGEDVYVYEINDKIELIFNS